MGSHLLRGSSATRISVDVVARGEFLPTLGTTTTTTIKTTTTTTTAILIGGGVWEKVGLIILTPGSWLEAHSGEGFGVYQRFCHVYIAPLRIDILQWAAARAIMSYRESKYDS